MDRESRCSFYARLRIPGGRGHCEFDCAYSTCDGEIEHCGKLNILKRYLMERNWMKATAERKKAAHD